MGRKTSTRDGDETGVEGDGMASPTETLGQTQTSRSRRVIGLIAAIGFSLAMWACIAMAALGFILKILS